VWFATGVVLTMVAAMMVTQAWRVGAAPGDEDSTVVGVSPPVRILDTRDGTDVGLPGPFASPTAQKLQVTGSIPTTTGTQIVVPDGATGVLLNVTAIKATNNGFVSIRPGDASGTPTTSNLNVVAGVTTPNAVTVALPTSGANAGQIDITYSADGLTGPTSDVFIDVVGFLTDTTLDEVAGRLDLLEADSGKVVTFSEVGAPTADVDFDTARAAAPEIPLMSTNTIDIYAKCIVDTTTGDLRGEIFVRTSIDGVILEGSEDLPDNTGNAYLDTTTLEVERQLDTGEASGGDLADLSEAEGYLIEPDGSYTATFTAISLKRPAAPAGDGPFGPGNACIFSGTLFS
jgi:hypothetical protein